MKPVKIIRAVAGVVAVIAIIYAVYHIVQSTGYKKDMDATHAAYDAAMTAEQFNDVKAKYEALLARARTAEQKKVAEGGIASCEANVAYLAAMGRGDVRKYADTVDKIQKAIKLTGDPGGEWTRRLEDFQSRQKGLQGPSVEQMRSDLARLKADPFGSARQELEGLYRWGAIWKDQGLFTDDAGRKEVLTETRKYLVDNYVRILGEDVSAARQPRIENQSESDYLQVKARPMASLESIRNLDPSRAAEEEKKIAKDVGEARAAAEKLAAMAK
jgi:hypothetical protein